MVPKNGRINLTIRPSDALSIPYVLTNIICTIQVSLNYHKIDLVTLTLTLHPRSINAIILGNHFWIYTGMGGFQTTPKSWSY